MEGWTGTENVYLHDLIELMEDCRQFYLSVIPGSSNDIRRLHENKAHCYATILAEIRQWKARVDNSTGEATKPATSSAFDAGRSRSSMPETYVTGDFFALLQRVNHIYDRSSFPTRRPPLVRVSAQLVACVFAAPIQAQT